MQRKILHFIWLAGILTAVPGCSSSPFPTIYKIDIRQGNYIDQEMIDRLRPGMTRRQVQFVLGTPLISDPFHQDRWDYLYRFKSGDGEIIQRHVTLYFEGERLARIENEMGPRS